MVGLDAKLTGREKEKDPAMVGDEVVELTAELGIIIGIDIGNLGLLRATGELIWLSRRCDTDGDTARRLEEVG